MNRKCSRLGEMVYAGEITFAFDLKQVVLTPSTFAPRSVLCINDPFPFSTSCHRSEKG